MEEGTRQLRVALKACAGAAAVANGGVRASAGLRTGLRALGKGRPAGSRPSTSPQRQQRQQRPQPHRTKFKISSGPQVRVAAAAPPPEVGAGAWLPSAENSGCRSCCCEAGGCSGAGATGGAGVAVGAAGEAEGEGVGAVALLAMQAQRLQDCWQ